MLDEHKAQGFRERSEDQLRLSALQGSQPRALTIEAVVGCLLPCLLSLWADRVSGHKDEGCKSMLSDSFFTPFLGILHRSTHPKLILQRVLFPDFPIHRK